MLAERDGVVKLSGPPCPEAARAALCHLLRWPGAREVSRRLAAALDEALANAVKHGHGGDEKKPVRVSLGTRRGRAFFTVKDFGSGFDPEAVPDPTLPENRERPSGRGIFLMRHFCDVVEFSAGGRMVRCEVLLGQGRAEDRVEEALATQADAG